MTGLSEESHIQKQLLSSRRAHCPAPSFPGPFQGDPSDGLNSPLQAVTFSQ